MAKNLNALSEPDLLSGIADKPKKVKSIRAAKPRAVKSAGAGAKPSKKKGSAMADFMKKRNVLKVKKY